jgi:hypothetical protein
MFWRFDYELEDNGESRENQPCHWRIQDTLGCVHVTEAA